MSTSQLKAVATQQQAAAQDPRDPHRIFRDQLDRTKPQFLRLMGGSASNVEQLCGVIERAVMDNPDLLHADRRSLVGACMKAAQDGLMPDGREAVLNIYNTKVKVGREEHWVKMVQYLPMVAGYIKGLYEHPDVAMVDAAAVYENDRFLFRRGDDPKLEHEPTLADESGKVVAAYLVVKLKSGEIKREVMPRRDIEKVRAASKSPDGVNSPWTKWYDQQAIKSVIKRGAKQLPRANKFDQIDRSDNEALGFAGTPDNVANAFMSANADMPALENNPSDVVEMPLQPTGEQVPVEAGGKTQEAGAAPPPQQQQPQGKAADAPKVTYAALADRLQKCTDRDTALVILDESRALPGKQQAELNDLFERQFPTDRA